MMPRHGYLYVADLSRRFGSEPGKQRPVVVVQSDLLNATGHPSTWVLPCTTRLTGSSVLRVVLLAQLAGNSETCEVMIDQSRAIDNSRLKAELGPLPAVALAEVKAKLADLADLSRHGELEAQRTGLKGGAR